MVNTRAKTKKARTTCLTQAPMEDPDHQSTQSGDLIGSNDDLLTEILHRLPVASILRFKIVSKHWRLLLSRSHFTNRYDSLSKSPGIIFGRIYIPYDVENRRPPSFRSLDFCFGCHDGIRIVQSCNGLLLCCNLRSIDNRKYCVLNPTTKQFAIIPSIRGGLKARKTICFMALAYHQTDCVPYKVICIRSLEPRRGLFQIQVYSSDTRKWNISVQSFAAFIPVFGQGVYWNGAVYWAPFYKNRNHLYFNIDVEQLQTLPLPVGLMSSKISTMYFGESRGHMHLILHMDHRDTSLRLNVYEMMNDHSGWFVKFQVQLNELLGSFKEMMYQPYYNFKVIDVVRGEEKDNTFPVLIKSKKMITYNVHDKSFKQIPGSVWYFYEDVSYYHRYTEALSSFKRQFG